MISPSLTLSQARGWYKGLRTNEVKLDAAFLAIPDLRDTDTKFSVPVFFIQGANDNVTPTSLVADYEQKIEAPVKRIDVVPDAGPFRDVDARERVSTSAGSRFTDGANSYRSGMKATR